jgi:K+-transporting ATPase ATPase A chain
MTYAWTIVAIVVLLALSWRYLGAYMVGVYEGRVSWLGWLERPVYQALRVRPEAEQSWQGYAASLTIFSGVALLITYLIMRVQGHLPLNPQHLNGVNPALSFNTAVSFVSNTSWQNYSGESTLSYVSQMMAITVQAFVSAAVGSAVAIAFIRGLARRGSPTIGNFWVDLVRGVIYILIPIAFVAGLVFVGQGAVQTLAGPAHIHNVLTGANQVLPRGPAAFFEPIKNMSGDGGGFFNANGAHPFENPTGVTNLLSIVLLLALPVALTYTFGKMVGSVRQGAVVLAAMTLIFGVWLGFSSYAEHGSNPAVAAASVVHQPGGNMEGKETRFGDTSSTLYNISGTQTGDGAVNSSLDSYTPIGGFGAMSGMMLGEVSPGSIGSGLYSILLFALIAVFLGGLMIGRTPEYLGKKIQAREVKLAAIGVLIMPLTVLLLVAVAVTTTAGKAGPLNAGPHAFSEILYSLTSQANNNGSAFAGLTGNTTFYNVTGAIAMLLGRFAIIIPVLALAGVLAEKTLSHASAGTFRTDTPLFTGLLVGVILIVGGLTFFPALALGPLVEQLSHTLF